MSKIENELFEDFSELPGWSELFLPSETAVPSEAIVRSTEAVRAAIAHDMSHGSQVPRTKLASPVSRWRRGGYLALLSTAAAAIFVAAPIIRTHGNPPQSVASAADFLREMAGTAKEAAGLNDDYWEVRFVSSLPEDGHVGDPVAFWFGRHGGRWITDVDGRVIKASGARAPFIMSETGAMTWAEINSLPSASDQLEQVLVEKFGQASLTTVTTRLLTIAPVTVAQRAALFNILANQPSVTLRANVNDAAGRTGTAVEFPFGPSESPSEVLTLLIAQDGTVLQVTESAIRDQNIPGTSNGDGQVTKVGDVISRTTYVEVHGYDTPPTQVTSMLDDIRQGRVVLH